MNKSTKSMAEMAVADLNAKAERLGWVRRFRLVPGSNANGIRHSMDVNYPNLVHPAGNIKIGGTYQEAVTYLGAMNEMLSQAIAERDRSAATVRSGEVFGTNGPFRVNRTVDIPEDDEESFPIRPALPEQAAE